MLKHSPTTLIKRARWTPSVDDKALLETLYHADHFPSLHVRTRLAEQLRIGTRQVQIWFQNRRQKERNHMRTGLPLEQRYAAETPSLQRADPAATHASGSALGATDADAAALYDLEDLADDVPSRRAAVGSSEADDDASDTTEPFEISQNSPALPPVVAGLDPSERKLHTCGSLAGKSSNATLAHVLQSPGGAKAVCAAARVLLRKYPLFLSPDVPCHKLLTLLSGLPAHEGGVDATIQDEAPAPQGAVASSVAMGDIAAIEVLSSQFYTEGIECASSRP